MFKRTLIIVTLGILVLSSAAYAAPQSDSLVDGNNAFALDLYHAVTPDQDSNTIFSPYSLSLALSMAYAGAQGNTAQQMAETLHFLLPPDELPAAFNALTTNLISTAYQLDIANALWGQQGFPFWQAFLDLLEANYDAGLRPVDFEADPEAARQVINQWVSDETAQRIQDLLGPGSIDTLTRLVLTNAIYFKAAWESPFDEAFTQDGDFHLLSDTTVTVPMMAHTGSYGYASGDGYQAVSLPYTEGRAAMVLLVPDAGQFETFESGLTADTFQTILESLTSQQVALRMPRFEYTSDFGLVDTLSAMGMPDAFSEQANFAGMTDQASLKITDVVHKAFIKVDEAGTEAAAATGVIVGLTSAPPMQAQEVTVDRPFITAIVDQDTGLILFLGRVLDPTDQ